MAVRWAVKTGNWSDTTVWNGGTLPQSGDEVYANGYTVTVNQNVTVSFLSTRANAGYGIAAGGGFTTSGSVTVTADTYAGTSTCLTVNANGQQYGNSYGGNATTSYAYGTQCRNGGRQYGNSYGGSYTNCHGTQCRNGGTQYGDSYPGSSNSAHGTHCAYAGRQIGKAYGQNSYTSYGTYLENGGIFVGDSYGGSDHANAIGAMVLAGGLMIGNAYGGGISGAHGAQFQNGGIFIGQAYGGSVSGAYGIRSTDGTRLFILLASGTVSGAYGAYLVADGYCIYAIKETSGSYAYYVGGGNLTWQSNWQDYFPLGPDWLMRVAKLIGTNPRIGV